MDSVETCSKWEMDGTDSGPCLMAEFVIGVVESPFLLLQCFLQSQNLRNLWIDSWVV